MTFNKENTWTLHTDRADENPCKNPARISGNFLGNSKCEQDKLPKFAAITILTLDQPYSTHKNTFGFKGGHVHALMLK